MRHVGVREFKEQATRLLGAGETLVVERHGKPIGFYIPVHAADRDAGHAALERLGQTLAALERRTGLSEEELVAALATDEAGA